MGNGTNFKGYLLKFGDVEFPQKYLAKMPKFTPNQRTEAEAYTDANNLLHRTTIDKYRTKIELETVSGLNLKQKIEIQNIINNSMTNSVERKCTVEYWNDEINNYSTGDFYIPDIEYNIDHITNNTIYYAAISVHLIEY